MIRSSGVAACAAVLLLSSLSACVDGDPPAGPDSAAHGAASILIAPSFSTHAGASDATVINRIRLTAINSATGVVIGTQDVQVDPHATEWQLSIEIDLGREASLAVVVEIELLDGEAVQWSGRTRVMTVSASSTGQPQAVEVYRGPLGNLAVESVEITDAPESLIEGAQTTLHADVTLVEGATASPQVFWTSLDPGILSVSEASGMVTALAPGVGRVRASAGPATDEAEIEVVARPASVALSPTSATLASLTQDVTFQAQVLDARGDEVSDLELAWSSDDETVLESAGGGVFFSVSNGVASAVVTLVFDPTITASAPVTVQQEIVQVAADPVSLSFVAIGQSAQVTATASDALGVAVADATFAWQTSDATVVTVDDAGTVVATGEGDATLTVTASRSATSGTATAEVAVSVAPVVAEVRVSPAQASLDAVGRSTQFVVEALDARGNALTGRTFTWASSDVSVATVSQAGVATATGFGTTEISATTDGVVGVASLAVLAPDLTIVGFEVLPDGVPATVITSADILFRVTVANQGGGQAGATDLALRILDAETELDLETPVVLPQPALAPGETTLIEWRTPEESSSSDETVPSGLTFEAITDYSHQVAESDETNNVVRSAVFDVSVSLPPGYTVGWIGGATEAEHDWHTAENWSTGALPSPSDNVFITDTPYDPVLSDTATIHDLALADGADLDLGDEILTVTGSVTAGNSIMGDGTLIMTGSDESLSGTVPDVKIKGDVSLAGTTVATGHAMVMDGGRLALAGHTLKAMSGLVVRVGRQIGAGLVMTDPSDELWVWGILWYDSDGPVSGEGLLTAGTIRVHHGIIQQHHSSHTEAVFVSTGTDVIYEGTETQNTSLATPGPAGSRFHTLTVSNGATISFTSDALISSTFTVYGEAIIGTSNLIDVADTFTLGAGALLTNDGVLTAGSCVNQGGTIQGSGSHPCGR